MNINHIVKISITILLVCPLNAINQNNYKVDSLKKVLLTANDALSISIHNKLFKLYYNQDAEIAKKHSDSALLISQRIKDNIGIANSSLNIGVYYDKMGSTNMAMEYYKKSLKIFEKYNNQKGKAACLNNIGNINYNLGKYDLANSYYKQALVIKEKLDDPYSYKQSLYNMGAIFYQLQDFDKAIEYFTLCIDKERQLDDSIGYGRTLRILGNSYFMKDEYEKAGNAYRQSLNIAFKQNDFKSIVENYDNLGIMSLFHGEYKNAIIFIDSSLSVANKIGFDEYIKITSLWLSGLYQNAGEYKKAYEHYELYSQVKEKILKEKNKIFELEQNYEKERMNMEFKHKQRIQLIMLLSSMLVILIIIVFVYYRYKTKQKLLFERKLAEKDKKRLVEIIEIQEKERKRIARDLHDTLGQVLSTTKMYVSELEHITDFKDKDDIELITNTINLVDRACDDVRNISHNLMPVALSGNLGLISALKGLVNDVNLSNQLSLDLQVTDFEMNPDKSVEIGIYRIIQEIVNNIIRHANAKNVNLKLINKHDKIMINITDDGVGLEKDKIEQSAGIGWKNIYSRVAVLNGDISVKKIKNNGTEIKIIINK